MKKISTTIKLISKYEILLGINYNDYKRVLNDNLDSKTTLTLEQIEVGFLFFKITINIHNFKMQEVKKCS